jgi:hypothetical protein
MKTPRAVLAGFFGAVAMSAAMFFLRLAGFNVSFEQLLGSVVNPQSPWLTGIVLHLTLGCVMGLVYASAFEMAMQSSGPLVGAGLGFSHAMLAGLFMSGIPEMNPFGSGSAGAPGAFLSNIRLGPPLFFALHLLYGAVVGLVYGAPLQKSHELRSHASR